MPDVDSANIPSVETPLSVETLARKKQVEILAEHPSETILKILNDPRIFDEKFAEKAKRYFTTLLNLYNTIVDKFNGEPAIDLNAQFVKDYPWLLKVFTQYQYKLTRNSRKNQSDLLIFLLNEIILLNKIEVKNVSSKENNDLSGSPLTTPLIIKLSDMNFRNDSPNKEVYFTGPALFVLRKDMDRHVPLSSLSRIKPLTF